MHIRNGSIVNVTVNLLSPHNFALHGPFASGAAVQHRVQVTTSIFFLPRWDIVIEHT